MDFIRFRLTIKNLNFLFVFGPETYFTKQMIGWCFYVLVCLGVEVFVLGKRNKVICLPELNKSRNRTHTGKNTCRELFKCVPV